MIRKSSKKSAGISKKVSTKEYTRSLRSIGSKSGREAYRENVALKLPVTYASRSRIIRESADGRKQVLGKLAPMPSTSASKGTVIRVKKN